MGKLCSKQSQSISNPLPSEKEVSICSYKSNADDTLKLQENKFNYLNKINFADFLYSLANYSNENATVEFKYDDVNIDFKITSPTFSDDFGVDVFQSFIENRILKHDNIYNAKIEESLIGIFKDNLIQNVTALNLKLKQSHTDDPNFTGVKKSNIIPYGLLYCVGANTVKIKAIFNLFGDNGIIKKSVAFDEFLLSLFLIASYCSISARNKLGKYDTFDQISKENLKELLNTAELKDCQNLVTVTNKLIFGEDLSLSLTYEQFKEKFKGQENAISFLLSPSGVRSLLEKNNV
jgi:hypothetical protein